MNVKNFDINTNDGHGPNNREKINYPCGPQGNENDGCVGSGDKQVNGSMIQPPENSFDSRVGEAMVQC